MNKALFLDRDGILNEIVFREGIVSSPRHIDELKIIPEAIPLVQGAKALGFYTLLITNQPDISRNKMTLLQLEKIHRKLEEIFPLDGIEVCTSSDDADPRRKPNPGMLLDAADKFNLDLAQCYFVGDSYKDVQAGKKAGVQTILLQTAYNVSCHGTADHFCDSLEAVTQILKFQEQNQSWNLRKNICSNLQRS